VSGDVASHAGKIIKDSLGVFERGENELQNDILKFTFRLNQLLGVALKS